MLLRHGESIWNRDKRFTGWTDVALSAEGVLQAERAGRVLQAIGCRFDVCFTSMLARATDTLRLTLQTMGLSDVPIRQSWRLNERHYGALQGLTLWQGVRRYGPRRVLGCQRRFAVPPPLLELADPRFPGLDPRYADLAPSQLPRGESVADTQRRVLPCWHEEIAPALRAGQCVLVVSHRNTLRALRKLLEGVADADTQKLKVPTGKPIVYELDAALRPLRVYFPGADPAADAAPGARAAERS